MRPNGQRISCGALVKRSNTPGCAVSFKRLLGSAALGATLPSRLQLARRALRGTVRAEDTAITRFGLQNLVTSRALVEVEACIRGHSLGLPMTAQGTGNGRVEVHEPRRKGRHLPNGSRLSCGALKNDSFPNLRGPPASS